MELIDQPLSRDILNRIALYLHGAQAGTGASELRRTLLACAVKLEAAARSLPDDAGVTPLFWPAVADLSPGVDASLLISHRSAGRMLALLLAEPGTTLSSHGLAASLGVSHASVRVFAFHLRNWLAAQGFAGALECRWGVGYAIAPQITRKLMRRHRPLEALVSAIRNRCDRSAAIAGDPVADPAPQPDPFPVVHHRALEARVHV